MTQNRRWLPAGLAVCLSLGTGCIMFKQHAVAGVTDESSRLTLRVNTIVYLKQDGLYLARGDGSDAARLLTGGESNEHLTILQAALSPAADRVAFLTVKDLNVMERTGAGLSLHIVTLTNPGGPASAVVSDWRRVQLEKIAPPGPDGRQEIFTGAALGWSPDGARIAVGLNRSASAGGDAVLMVGADGAPQIEYDIAPNDLAPVSSISWTHDAGVVLLGGQVDGSTEEATGIILRLEETFSGVTRRASIAAIGPGAYPTVSPDGSKIAIVDERSGHSDLVLLDMTGRELERFSRPAGRGLTRPQWSPDGRFLYYHSLASTGPLGLIDITMVRCLDTRTKQVFDIARL